jgi:hypothetical protein
LVRNSTSIRQFRCGRKLGNRLVVDPVEMTCSVDALAIAATGQFVCGPCKLVYQFGPTEIGIPTLGKK